MFETIIGHEQQKQYFNQIVQNGSFAHAYCFEGVDGIGKFTFARTLAKSLLCDNKSDLEAKFETDNHPDYLCVTADGNTIKTEQIEALHSFIHMKPFLSELKIVIIDDAPTMTEQAQNKLLKLIEEPPGHALFLLTTENAYKLLPTVRSRLIRIPFHPLTIDQLTALVQKRAMTVDVQLLGIAMGSMGHYMRWHEDQVFCDGVEKFFVLLEGLCENKASKWLKQMDVFDTLKDDVEMLLEIGRVWFQDMMVLKEGGSDDLLRLSFKRQNMVQCTQYVTSLALISCIDAIDESIAALKRQQNYQLVTEAVLYRIQEALHG